MLKTGTLTKTHNFERGIQIGTSSTINVVVKDNFINGPRFSIYDPSARSLRGQYLGAITSGTSNTDLVSVTIPKNTLGTNSKIRIVAFGAKTGTSGTKTVTFYFGSVSYVVIPAITTASDWRIEVDLLSAGYNAQDISVVGIDGTSVVFLDSDTRNVDCSEDVIVKCVGKCSNAADTINLKSMTMDIM
jgi:hypothetical protein